MSKLASKWDGRTQVCTLNDRPVHEQELYSNSVDFESLQK